jgi:hypothetical protein
MMKSHSIRQKGGLAYEIAAIMAAIALCACTYYFAGMLDTSPVKTFAGAAQSRN